MESISQATATAKLVETRPIKGALEGQATVWEIPGGRYSMFWNPRYKAVSYTLYLKNHRAWNAVESGGLPTEEAVHQYAARRLPQIRRERNNAIRRWRNRARREQV